MSLRAALLASLIFTALTLVPAGAHLMSLPNKIGMTGSDYMVAQRAYMGWNLSAILVIGAALSTGIFAWRTYGRAELFAPALVALACVIATQVVFWTLTWPGNHATSNWTRLPHEWQELRHRWELGHALSALLNVGALAALFTANWRLLRPA
jgi:hypothetical protein